VAFPTIAGQTSGLQSTNSVSWTGTFPGSIAAGDLILVIVGNDGSSAFNPATGTGWVQMLSDNAGGSAAHITCFGKIAGGTESGNISIVTSGGSEQGCWLVLRITGWYGSGIGVQAGATAEGDGTHMTAGVPGTGTGPDPPSANPANWGTEDTLWLALAVSDHGATTYTGKDADYTYVTGSPQESTGAGGAALAVAYLASAVAAEDPAAYTTDASEQYTAATVAIRPAASAVFVPRIAFLMDGV
jgi:hypothetical protein